MITNKIEDILKNLVKSGNTYLCEKQLQFALVQEFENYFNKEKVAHKIYLEYPFKNSSDNPIYCDILIEEENKKCAIELKYKTKKQVVTCYGNQFILKNHSAQDLGRFDFLRDVSRIEGLINNKQVDYGYAIFITNDSCYWNTTGNGCIYEAFALNCRRNIPAGVPLSWPSNININSIGKNRYRSLLFNKSYDINWNPYYNQFKYLIFKI